MAVFIIYTWFAAEFISICAIVIEAVNIGYLIFSGKEINFVGFGVEVVAFALLAMFSHTKFKKAKAAAVKSGPLITEKQKAEMKKNGKSKPKINWCREAMPWLITCICLYVAFIVMFIVTLVYFSWPRLGICAVLVILSGFCVYKYMFTKQRIAAKIEKDERLARKAKAREAAILRHQNKKDK